LGPWSFASLASPPGSTPRAIAATGEVKRDLLRPLRGPDRRRTRDPDPPPDETVHRTFDGHGDLLDCDLYAQTPSYTQIDRFGHERKVSLPPIPGVTREDYSGRGSQRRIDDEKLLEGAALLVRSTNLNSVMEKMHLLIPGRTGAVELGADAISRFEDVVQGCLHAIYLHPMAGGGDQKGARAS
jgi:hypothetical protein